MPDELTDRNSDPDNKDKEPKDKDKDRKGIGGPKTPQGRAISSQNALKHGLTATTFSIIASQQEAYEKLRTDLLIQIRPVGTIEEEIFEHAAQSAFNRRRAEACQGALPIYQSDPMGYGIAARHFDRMERYKLRYERAFYRALKELKNLQTERAHRDALPAEVVEKLPPLAQLQKYSKRTPRPGPSEGPGLANQPPGRESSQLEARIRLHRERLEAKTPPEKE